MSLVALQRNGGETIYSQIAKLLKEEIASFLTPGECLPSENELAGRFGVNRHTVRRAVEDLIAAGLLERRHGKGTFRAARERGMSTVFGAPNILRGKSQSGAIRALDAVLAGVADCLCADYHPATLIVTVFRLPELAGISLAESVRLVSANPARAAGLADRGEITVGKRADLVAVTHINGLAQASSVFSAGKLVFEARFDHG